MSFRRVKAGDPVSIAAGAYNAWCAAAEAYQAGNQGMIGQTGGGRPDRIHVRVRNDSGADRARFEVLGVAGPLFTPTDNLAEFLRDPALIGVAPSNPTHVGRFVILLEPVPSGRIGWAVAAGIVPVTINMQCETDRFADVTTGYPAFLTSGPHGAARILWAESGTGQKRALVLLGTTGGVPALWGKLDDDLDHEGTVTVSVWSDDWSTDTLADLTAVSPPPSMTAGVIPVGSWVQVAQRPDGEWYVIHAIVEKAVITSLRRHEGKLQYKTTAVLVFAADPEAADWTDVAGQTDISTQTILTNFQVSGLTLQTKSRSVYVDPAAAESDWTTKHTGTDDCPE